MLQCCLACLSQLAKGNLKIAKQALTACEAMAEHIDSPQEQNAAKQVAQDCAKAWQVAQEGMERSQ